MENEPEKDDSEELQWVIVLTNGKVITASADVEITIDDGYLFFSKDAEEVACCAPGGWAAYYRTDK